MEIRKVGALPRTGAISELLLGPPPPWVGHLPLLRLCQVGGLLFSPGKGSGHLIHLPQAGGIDDKVIGKWEEEFIRAKVVTRVTHSPIRGTAVVVVKSHRSVGEGK